MDGKFTTEEMILLIRNPELNKMVNETELQKRQILNKKQEELRKKLWVEDEQSETKKNRTTPKTNQ